MTKSQVIKVVLDQMYELYHIDTSEVWPDDLLNDFGLDDQSIAKVVQSSLLKLGCIDFVGDVDRSGEAKTAREIVEIVHAHVSLLKDSRTSDAA